MFIKTPQIHSFDLEPNKTAAIRKEKNSLLICKPKEETEKSKYEPLIQQWWDKEGEESKETVNCKCSDSEIRADEYG